LSTRTAQQLGHFVGYIFLGFVAIPGGWWGRGKLKAPAEATATTVPPKVEAAGVLIDSKASEVLAGSIEGLALEVCQIRADIQQGREAAAEEAARALQLFQQAVSEVGRHREDMQEHQEELRRHGDRLPRR
jgi:hypothetical protein